MTIDINELMSGFKKKRDALVFIYLLSIADENGVVKDSCNKIADDLETHHQVIARIIKRLSEIAHVRLDVRLGVRLKTRQKQCITICDYDKYKDGVRLDVRLDVRLEEKKENEKRENEKETPPAPPQEKEKDKKEKEKKEPLDRQVGMSTTNVVDAVAERARTYVSPTIRVKHKYVSPQIHVSLNPEIVRSFFNNTMTQAGSLIPKIRTKLSNQRLAFLKARIKEYGINAVYEVITKASRSKFLNGGGRTGFVADFTWLMRPNNFPKVLDGNYDNRPTNPTNTIYGDNQQCFTTDRREQERQQRLTEYAGLAEQYLKYGKGY